MHCLERKDPDKVAIDKHVNKIMKQTNMQKKFHPGDDEEDNAQMIELLEDMFVSKAQIRTTMEQHFDLMNSMARSDTINEVEKHQKKSLKQIRNLMLDVVKKRKLRNQSIGLHYQANLTGKAPDLEEVR